MGSGQYRGVSARNAENTAGNPEKLPLSTHHTGCESELSVLSPRDPQTEAAQSPRLPTCTHHRAPACNTHVTGCLQVTDTPQGARM